MYVTIKDCARRFVLLKLTTDRHEASRGLFATAELLVIFGVLELWHIQLSIDSVHFLPRNAMQARPMSSCGVCVCVSRSCILSKRIKISSKFFYRRVAKPFQFFRTKRHGNIPTETPLTGASNAGGVGRNRDSEPIYACCYAATSQVLSTRSPVDHGHRRASCDTSLVVSGGADCRRRRRNVYDKKPQPYAKDNRTAHLTARSDKSVAYVTNNKRLYTTFCTIEVNY